MIKCKKILGIKKEAFLFDFSSRLEKISSFLTKECIVSYLYFENAVFYNFDVLKEIFNEIEDIDSFVGIKISDEFGSDEKIVKYTFFKTYDRVVFSCVAVTKKNMKAEFKEVLKKVSYIDYVSFVSFSFEVLYEKMEKMCDAFIVLSSKEGLISFYKNGRLIFISHILFGYENNDFLSEDLKKEIKHVENYLGISVKRIFIDRELEGFENFNLSGTDIFLEMGAKQALYDKQGVYNFSIFLRKKNFFEKNRKRVLNIFLLSLSFLLVAVVILRHYSLQQENIRLKKELVKFNFKINDNLNKLKLVSVTSYKSLISEIKNINSKKPKSLCLSEFGVNFEKYGVFLKKLSFKKGVFLFEVYSENENSLFDFMTFIRKNFKIKDFFLKVKNGFVIASFKAVE